MQNMAADMASVYDCVSVFAADSANRFDLCTNNFRIKFVLLGEDHLSEPCK